MAKIVYRQTPAPRELCQQILAPQAKAGMQKPQGGGKCLVQILGDVRGQMVMDEIDTCIISALYRCEILCITFYVRIPRIFVHVHSAFRFLLEFTKTSSMVEKTLNKSFQTSCTFFGASKYQTSPKISTLAPSSKR